MVQIESFFLIYLDIVGYSKKNENIQVRLFEELQFKVSYLLNRKNENEIIFIPTGDGMIIAIKENTSNYLDVINFIISIYQWILEKNEKIRSSIHIGELNIIKDINKNNNLVGDSINNAARMLSGAQDNSIVISKQFSEKYLPNNKLNAKYNINHQYAYKLIDEDTIIDKHGFEHLVYSVVFFKDEIQYGVENKILNKYFTNVYSSDYPKKENFYKSFINRVKDCQTLTLFGIYHLSVIEILEKIEVNDNRKVKIDIYFASDELEEQLIKFFKIKDAELNIGIKKQSLKDILNWRKNHLYSNNIELKIFEYSEFPYFGFSMVDGEVKKKGFIHFSNYFEGINPQDTPYIETMWRTNIMPPMYKFYFNFIKLQILQNKKFKQLKE